MQKSLMNHLIFRSILVFGICFSFARMPMAGDIVINAVGDIMLAGRWANHIKAKGYAYPFETVKGELAAADINLANLESPLGKGGREYTAKKFRFRGAPEIAKALADAGFDVVTLANNHIMDFGAGALSETLASLDKADVAWTGAGRNMSEARQAVMFEIKGKKVAFLGYSLTQPTEFFAGPRRPGTAPGYEQYFVPDISAARKEADYVIVSFHWGKEGSGKVQAYQRAAARKAILAGADAVIGHHPHVLQGVERFRNGIIFYSLGNFAFASKSRTAEYGAMVRLRLGDGRREAEVLPLDVLSRRVHFQPRVLKGQQAVQVISEMNRLSLPMKTRIELIDGRYAIRF